MTSYTRKPIVVDAVQWDGTEGSTDAVFEFLGASQFGYSVSQQPGGERTLALYTETLRLAGKVGDWIVRTDTTTYIVVPQEQFAADYEAVV